MRNIYLLLVLCLALLIAACGGGAGDEDAASAKECPERVFPLAEPGYNAKRSRDFTSFESALAGLSQDRVQELDTQLFGITIPDIQDLMDSGDITSEELVAYYLYRIQRYDFDLLNAVMELNPDVLASARQLDQERASGSVRVPLHGIPVLIK